MKKIVLILGLVGILVSGAFGLDMSVKVTNEAREKIDNITNNDFEKVIIYNNAYYPLKYNDYTKSFNEIQNTTASKSDKYITIDQDGEFSGECVSFVKSMTNDKGLTKEWERGTQVTKNANIKSGSQIATFGSDGKYNHLHTAIFLSKRTNYIWVIDQNWGRDDGLPGIVGIHKIHFSGSGVNNANSYFAVE